MNKIDRVKPEVVTKGSSEYVRKPLAPIVLEEGHGGIHIYFKRNDKVYFGEYWVHTSGCFHGNEDKDIIAECSLVIFPGMEFLLEGVWVDENHRGKGLASTLIDEVIYVTKMFGGKCFAASRNERLHVHEMYRKHGFIPRCNEARKDIKGYYLSPKGHIKGVRFSPFLPRKDKMGNWCILVCSYHYGKPIVEYVLCTIEGKNYEYSLDKIFADTEKFMKSSRLKKDISNSLGALAEWTGKIVVFGKNPEWRYGKVFSHEDLT